MSLFMDYIGFTIIILLLSVIVFLYVKNFIKAIVAVRRQEYTVHTALRCIGIFVFFVGIFMGTV